jgi:GntR family transcriptional repressor for pyruvate dehydrogenase complex
MANPAVIRSRDDLAALLVRRITSGELAPGTLLPSERTLAEEHGLSRSMVREALAVLGERRLIDIVPGRGSFVRETTVDDAIERMIEIFDHRGVTLRALIEARSMIETTATGLASQRATGNDLERITISFLRCESATSVLDRIQWDLAFHQAIVRAAQNALVETMFSAIQPYIVELLVRSLTDSDVTREGLQYHGRIVEAITARDTVRASEEMRQHLTLGLTMFGDDVDRNLNLVARDAMARMSTNRMSFEDLLRLAGGSGIEELPHLEVPRSDS